jgi:hypothetical protein
MSDSNSVLTRIPAEIWRKILLDVMYIPYLLDTTCIGSLFKLWIAIDDPTAQWNRSEWQRKLLRRVCKSWKHFAETKAYRSIEFQDPLQEPHILAHARRALLCRSLGHMITIPTFWEVVEISKRGLVDEVLVSIVQGYHPRLRRLSVRTDLFSVFTACESAAFCQLTFLHLQFYPPQPQTTTVIQTTLPRLEVLIWESSVVKITPSDIFRLPNLHHFGWSIAHAFPLSTLLSFASTLRSLSIRNERLSKSYVVLPDLNEFPHLEELSINVPFEIKDPKPLPPTYPLHTIYMSYCHSHTVVVPCIMQILYFNPAKLRRIQFPSLKWGHGGEVENAWDLEEEVQIVQLANMCHKRGIRIEGSKGTVRSEIPPMVEPSDFKM